MIFSKNKGFTLVELLVVIAVIGLLSSIILVSINGVREKARVARALSDLEQIVKAVNLYYLDTAEPPPHDHSWDDSCERAAFGSGNFAPKPSGWAGKYISWPKNPWSLQYHFEEPYGVSVNGIPLSSQQTIDNKVDDGNLGTGSVVSWGATRLEYRKGLGGVPFTNTHFTSCTP